MAKNNFYAVKVGVIPGIYPTWDEAKKNVNGFPNADFKGFKTMQEAKDYMGDVERYIINMSAKDIADKEKIVKKPCIDTDLSGITEPFEDEQDVEFEITEPIDNESDCVIVVELDEKEEKHSDIINIYTDGSYKDGRVGYGVVVVNKDGQVISKLGGSVHCDDMESRNIIGEVEGVIKAIEYCFANGINEVIINYDSIGLERWYTGAFKAKSNIAKYYMKKMKIFSDYITIHFNKIKGHSGDKFNEMADEIARRFTLIDLI